VFTTKHGSTHHRPGAVRFEILLGTLSVAAWLENEARRLGVKTKEHRCTIANITASIYNEFGRLRQAPADTLASDYILHHDTTVGYREPVGERMQKPSEAMAPFPFAPKHRPSCGRRIQHCQSYGVSHR
jgi:hypothetical protein